MTVQELDFLFPFIVLTYGVMMSFVLHNKKLMKLAHERFPQHLVQQMETSKYLALFCLVTGTLWSLQNLWL